MLRDFAFVESGSREIVNFRQGRRGDQLRSTWDGSA